MHNILQRDFSGGWNPSADDLNAPGNCLLRADNLVWDEDGQVTLRQGITKLYDLPTAILNLFTADIGSNRQTFQFGNDSTAYFQGNPLIGAFDGQGDIVAGSALGQVFIARGTTKRRWDTITPVAQIPTWGIRKPQGAPVLAGVAGPITTVDTGDVGNWSASAADGTVTSGSGHSGGPAVVITTNPSTRRGVATRVFAADRNYEGSPEDVIELYIATNNPRAVEGVQVAFDLNSNGDALFSEDVYYYDYTFENSARVPTTDQFIALDPDVEGEERRRLVEERQKPTPIVSRIATAVAAEEFVKVSAPRSAFLRQGGTPGKDWDTVHAVRVAIQFVPGEVVDPDANPFTLTFDNIQIGRGRLTGTYFSKVVFVRNLPSYVAKSGPSPASESVTVKNGNIEVQIPPASASGIDEAWVFLLGGTLDRYYRFAVGQPGDTITISVSERDALVDNITLDRWNEVPPDDIIDILDGLHYGRLMVLTPDGLYPSRPNDPDHYGSNQVLQVGDVGTLGERNQWIARTLGGVYVGTNRDIYRIDGVGDEQTDGTIGFRVIPMNVEAQPMHQGAYPLGAVRAVATEGSTLCYMSADGPREFNGSISVPLRGNTDLLWKWQNRYAIGHVDFNGRIRMALNFGYLYIMVSEGTASSSTNTIWRLDMRKGAAGWSRFVFEGGRNITTLYKERAAIGSAGSRVLAGDENGRVYWLESCPAAEGEEGKLSVILLPPITDNGQPFHRKDAMDLQVSFEATGDPATVELYLDRKALPAVTYQATAQRGERQAWRQLAVGQFDPFIRAQFKLYGFFTSFRLYHFGMSYRLRPQLSLARDTGYLDLSHGDLVWIRQAYVRIWSPVDVRVIAYLDDRSYEAQTIEVTAGYVKKYRVDFGRSAKGTQLRVLVIPVVKNAIGVDIDPVPAATSPSVAANEDRGMRIDEFSNMRKATDPDAWRARGPGLGFFVPEDDPSRAPTYPTGFFDGQESSAFELYDIRVQIRQSGNWTEKLIVRNTQPEERNG